MVYLFTIVPWCCESSECYQKELGLFPPGEGWLFCTFSGYQSYQESKLGHRKTCVLTSPCTFWNSVVKTLLTPSVTNCGRCLRREYAEEGGCPYVAFWNDSLHVLGLVGKLGYHQADDLPNQQIRRFKNSRRVSETYCVTLYLKDHKKRKMVCFKYFCNAPPIKDDSSKRIWIWMQNNGFQSYDCWVSSKIIVIVVSVEPRCYKTLAI